MATDRQPTDSELEQQEADVTTSQIAGGYYWARHTDNSRFIVLIDGGNVYVPGVGHPVTHLFNPASIVGPVIQYYQQMHFGRLN